MLGRRSCQLVLPCTGVFVLRACAVEYANGTAVGPGPEGSCSEMQLGRTLEAWKSNPWQNQPGAPGFRGGKEPTRCIGV